MLGPICKGADAFGGLPFEPMSLKGLRLITVQGRIEAYAIEFGLLVLLFADRQTELILGIRPPLP